VALNARGYDVANTQLRLYASSARILLKAVSATFVAITWNGTDATMTSANYVITYQPSSLPSVSSLGVLGVAHLQGGENSDEYGKVHLRPYMRGFTATNLHPRTEYDFCLSCEHVDGTLVHLHCVRVMTKYGVIASSSLGISPLLTAFDVAIATLGLAVLLLLFSVFGLFFKRYTRRSLYEQPRGFDAYGRPQSSTTSIAVDVDGIRETGASMGDHGAHVFGATSGEFIGKSLGVRRLASMSQIPLRNLYEPPSTPLSTSRTSLLGPYPVQTSTSLRTLI